MVMVNKIKINNQAVLLSILIDLGSILSEINALNSLNDFNVSFMLTLDTLELPSSLFYST